MLRVQFQEWTFEADVDRTKEVYKKVHRGGSDECRCDLCENYRIQKEFIFPNEVLDLFVALGIDLRKECEIYATHKLENGCINYHGWFHFVGHLIAGPNCKQQVTETVWTMDLLPVTSGFQIGFCEDRSLAFFDKEDDLVQVEFETGLSWRSERPEPNEI